MRDQKVQKSGNSSLSAVVHGLYEKEREEQHAEFFIAGFDLDKKTEAGGPHTGHRGDRDGALHRSLAAYLLRISK